MTLLIMFIAMFVIGDMKSEKFFMMLLVVFLAGAYLSLPIAMLVSALWWHGRKLSDESDRLKDDQAS